MSKNNLLQDIYNDIDSLENSGINSEFFAFNNIEDSLIEIDEEIDEIDDRIKEHPKQPSQTVIIGKVSLND